MASLRGEFSLVTRFSKMVPDLASVSQKLVAPAMVGTARLLRCYAGTPLRDKTWSETLEASNIERTCVACIAGELVT